MTIPILVNGAFGRMGQITTKMIQEHPNFELVGQTGREYDLKKSILDSGAQVVIDFTNPEAVYENTLTIIETKAHPVIGTTGLDIKQIKSLQEKCDSIQLGGIIAPNFSLGAVLLMRYAKEIAKYFNAAEIIEMHHQNKVDSPSGTALRTAELMAEGAKQLLNAEANKKSQETVPGARGANYQGVPIHAVRLPGLLAHVRVVFGNVGETLTLQHDSIDRQCFMPGVAMACEKVMGLKKMVYGLEGILS